MRILHIARRADWDDAVRVGAYRVSTRGASLEQVGFIHASLPEQVADVAGFLYRDADDELCVLVMDEDAIRSAGTDVRREDGGDGALYPHVYGPIDPAWVTEVRPARFDESGRFTY